MAHNTGMGWILGISVAVVSILVSTEAPCQPSEFTTEWVVRPAPGLDAILLLGAASGDVMQAQPYAEDIEWVRSRFSADGLAALDTIDGVLRVRLGLLTGPTLAYYFSAGPVETLEQVIESAADPIGRLKPGLMQSPQWDPQDFEAAVRLMPAVHTALLDLESAGFTQWYETGQRANLDAATVTNLKAVQSYDIIPEQERLLGRPLDPRIEILLVNYAQPYGIRISGQRFVAYHGWDAQTQLRVAAHEIFHPPFARDDTELNQLLDTLRSDPWMSNIVENHDPKYGYNSFAGVVNEDSTQALDQIVSERLGFARDPGPRWRESDGGMHMLAPAIYQAMKISGFAETGGSYAEWFKAALRDGLLSPDSVRKLSAEVVGEAAVNAWSPD